MDKELIGIIRNTNNTEKAIEVATEIIINFLKQL